LRDQHSAIVQAGARVIAVSPDELRLSERLTGELALPYSVLCDRDGVVAGAFGVARDGEVAPAAFLLDRRATVRWSSVGRHPEDQPSPRTALGVLTGRGVLAVPGPSRLLTPAVAAIATAMCVVVGVLAAVANHELLAWDLPVQETVRDMAHGWLGSALEVTNGLGSRWLIGALTIPMAALAWSRCRQLAVVLVLALPAGLALELGLKALVDRPRPPLAEGFGSSFPSGHVLAAAAFWGLVPPWALIVTRRRSVWAASVGLVAGIVVAVGLSRIYVGAHWPSDVLGGYVIGAMFLLAAEWAVRRPSRVLHCESCHLHPARGAVPRGD
jgi:undecaprenyl-diphosphatase